MQTIFRFSVIPQLPQNLEPLREMAFNLWFSWEPDATALFEALDPEMWERCYHNPVKLLQRVRQARLREAAEDRDGYVRRLGAVYRRFQDYLHAKDTWFSKNWPQELTGPVAYFSAEFGIHESVPEYSGGLGILAGDHCKAASDLGLPFVAVGLLYRHGYFRQRLNKEGWQEAVAMNINFNDLPVQEVRCPDGTPLTVQVDILGRPVTTKVWEIKVGRIPLFTLDTDVPSNREEDRLITSELYGGDIEMRIRQEIVLGIGGVRALKAMGISPSVFHMNEGHAAFLGMERIRQLMIENNIDFYPALQVTAASNVFTTHTPVAAGNDAFQPELMHRYFDSYARELRVGFDEFLKFGRAWNHQPSDPFSMTNLALRLSRRANGVSALHGKVSQKMWTCVWPNAPIHEVPISSVTNGIHLHTWLAPEMRNLYEKYFGSGWQDRIGDTDLWRRVSDIPDEELWSTHLLLKKRLIEFVRRRVREHRERLGESPDRLRSAMSILDPEVLTIGFARRFATYKRALLIFKDKERLISMVNKPDRPVQIVVAGKSHPRDDAGKRLIQQLYRIIHEPEFEGKVVFVEDYDANVARHLVQGVDVWLNSPLRPLEASGTSGQKVPPNGGINLSVLDGWWCEGFNGKNGWAIGAEIQGGSPELQDEVDAKSLYHILDQQVIPLYYAKPDGRLPLAWINLMRESIRSVSPVYNTWRMVREYTERFYAPAAHRGTRLQANNFAEATELGLWKRQIREAWPQAAVQEIVCDHPRHYEVLVGEKVPIRAKVFLGRIAPEHVLVEIYYGEAEDGELRNPATIRLEMEKQEGEGAYWYAGHIEAIESGAYGFNIRLIPTHPNLTQKHELRLVTWGNV
ncbi:MAG: alpha-glucan family phosphorylase [Verrucomicrobia bacterium]|nr:alpha-glucan family phosphorylase [Verrucomicrobiota bacterium]